VRLRLSSPSLAGRLLIASALLAALLGAVFVVLFAAVVSSRDATRGEERARDLTEETFTIERLVLDADTGVQGFVVTQDERFLQRWRSARRQMRTVLPRFERLTGASSESSDEARLVQNVRDFVGQHSRAVVDIAREQPEAARTDVAQQEGRFQRDEIRMLLQKVRDTEERTADARAESADDTTRRAVWLAAAGLIVSSLGIVLFAAYLARTIARPVRDVADAAERFAGGRVWPVLLPEHGPQEIGQLTRSFNVMARELDRQKSELEQQNAQLRESEQLKSELIAVASHEVRTPLSSVLGFTKLLLKDDSDAETRRRYLGIVEAQAERLAALLDDFLTLDRLEKGQLGMRDELVDMTTVLRDQVELFEAESEGHHLELQALADSLPVRGDPARLTQIVGNLLSNAIKYSPGGGIVEVVAERTNRTVRVSVNDEGLGIPTEQQDRIFTKFFRGTAVDSGIPGSGLGLAFSRAVAEAHGGRITFASTAGEGSTFSLELPAAQEGADGSNDGSNDGPKGAAQ
jgi:signal transduction histidine kinase